MSMDNSYISHNCKPFVIYVQINIKELHWKTGEINIIGHTFCFFLGLDDELGELILPERLLLRR